MTLLLADQDADIKAKQEQILKLEQDIKVRLAEIEAINNVRDYFNTPEFRQRVSDKKKRRKLDIEDEDEEEQEAQPAPKKNPIAEIVTNDKRDEQLKKEENELLTKLREVNKSNSEYKKDIEEIKEFLKTNPTSKEVKEKFKISQTTLFKLTKKLNYHFLPWYKRIH